MRPFNLEEYLKNPSIKIITRNHCPVRIICTNRLDNHDNNIVALIHSMDPEMDIEYTQYYPEDGMYLPTKEPHPSDLFFATESDYTDGWINLYKIGKEPIFAERTVFPTKELALHFKVGRCYLTTAKINSKDEVEDQNDSKKYGWIHMYNIGDKRYTDGYVYLTKEHVENSESVQGIENKVVMIEWEE